MPKKILINLLSEQQIPNFIAVMQQSPDVVYALVTPRFEKQVARFKEFTGVPHEARRFDPYNFNADFEAIAELMQELPPEDEVTINFTGGTKIMSLATVLSAMAHRGKRRIDLIYVDTASRQLERIRFEASGKLAVPNSEALALHIPFQAYAGLQGEHIKSFRDEIDGAMRDREQMMKALLSSGADNFFGRQKACFHANGKLKERGAFNFKPSRRTKDTAEGSCTWGRDDASLKLPSGKATEISGSNCSGFLAGGWLEDFVFMRLASAEKYQQVLQNVVLEFSPETIKKLEQKEWRVGKTDKNEVDIVVADGIRAVLIECKAGKVHQNHLHKLTALRRELLGPFGKAVLVCRFAPDAGLLELAKEKQIYVVAGDRINRITSEVERIMRG